MTLPGPDPRSFIAATGIIDCNDPAIRRKARELAAGLPDPVTVAGSCFLFVRDSIRHSADAQDSIVTLRASEVLRQRTGLCYAKSHLLAALLRANGIPAGLCYQRLAVEGTGRPFALHGLNAVYLPEHGWCRIDARGNRPGVEARFDPPRECLAFIPREPGEADIAGIFPEPLPEVVECLSGCAALRDLLPNLPDRGPAGQ